MKERSVGRENRHQYLFPPSQLRELAADTISIKTNKEQCQKRGGTVLYFTSSSSKERSLLQPYIAIDNDQEQSNEELATYSCLWTKAAVKSKYKPTKHKEVD
jgi:hypothetical protein